MKRPTTLWPPTRSIGTQVLLWVNVAWVLLAAIFLAYDYRRELRERLGEKQISLLEEAKTLMPAVLQIRRYGRDQIQDYIDAVCGQMRDSQSPGHHIVVESRDAVVQATAHHRASPEMLQAVHLASASPTRRSAYGSDELVVGSCTRDGTTIYVSETLESMRRNVIGDAVRRMTAMFVMAIVATAIVNLVLWQVVTRPLNRLVVTVKEIGKGALGTQAEAFSSLELAFLAREINTMSTSLAEADQERKRQMEQAREIQLSLLPEHVTAPGVNIASMYLPADDVGGDYFDALKLQDGSYLLAIGDVSGHGVPAAMSAAMLKVLLVQAAERYTSPARILAFINRILITAGFAGSFVSMALTRVVSGASRIEYASAGHEPSWLLSPDGTTMELSSTGMLLGVLEDSDWDDVTANVVAGSRLFMVTDGVSEAMSPEGELYRRARIREHLERGGHNPLDAVIAGLTESLKKHRLSELQHDDVTMLLIELHGLGPEESARNRLSGSR